jgi:two-component system NarL family response regulator
MLVDDHVMFRTALRMTLQTWPDIEIVAEAGSASAALAQIADTRVDVVCLDVNLPDQHGVEVARQLLTRQPDLKIIGLSSQVDLAVVAQMLQAGALGYVDKSNAGRDLHRAIQTVGCDQVYLHPDLDVHDVSELIASALPDQHLAVPA